VLPRDQKKYYGDKFTEATDDEHLRYFRYYSWGAVVETKKGNAIRLCPEVWFKPSGQESEMVIPRHSVRFPQIGTIEVGRTQHNIDSWEILGRVLALDVCTYGQAQKEPKKLFGFLGQLAFDQPG
jgi:hypothetical protein